MGLIVYNGKTVLDAKNSIDTCNGEILEALKKIDIELYNMKNTLDTPKSSKRILEIANDCDKIVKFVSETKDNCNAMFNTINNEYDEYMKSVSNMVGGNNGSV